MNSCGFESGTQLSNSCCSFPKERKLQAVPFQANIFTMGFFGVQSKLGKKFDSRILFESIATVMFPTESTDNGPGLKNQNPSQKSKYGFLEIKQRYLWTIVKKNVCPEVGAGASSDNVP